MKSNRACTFSAEFVCRGVDNRCETVGFIRDDESPLAQPLPGSRLSHRNCQNRIGLASADSANKRKL